MKKTTSISIAHTLFYIEDDAFQKLDHYLRSIKEYFSKTEDREEILKDIESRIAELFIEYIGFKDNASDRIVTISHVEKVIKSMGTIEDFAYEESDPHAASSAHAHQHGHSHHTGNAESDHAYRSGPVRKKLYRDVDEGMIGGVCSGLANYLGSFFGFETTLIRIVFLISLFFGGAGAIIYVILWLIVPAASSSAQKLEMRGEAVTIESMREAAKDKSEKRDQNTIDSNLKQNQKEIGSFVRRMFNLALDIIKRAYHWCKRHIFPVLGLIVGTLINIGVTIAFIALISGFIIASINNDAQLFSFPLTDIVSLPMYHFLLTAAFAVIAIPLIFFSTLGTKLRNKDKKRSPSSRTTLVLMSVWITALVIGIVAVASLHGRYENKIKNDPLYQTSTQSYELGAFDSLNISHGQNIVIKTVPAVAGTTTQPYSINAIGRGIDMERLSVENDAGTLVIKNKDVETKCLFCFTRRVTLEITAPDFSKIQIKNGSNLAGENLMLPNTTIIAENGGNIDISASSTSMTLQLENGSRARIDGTVQNLIATAQNGSFIKAELLTAQYATTTAKNSSRIDTQVIQAIEAYASNSSTIISDYPTKLKKTSSDNASRINIRSEDEYANDMRRNTTNTMDENIDQDADVQDVTDVESTDAQPATTTESSQQW